jgi:hypothetical protein
MDNLKACPAPGGSAGHGDSAFPGGTCGSEHAPKPEVPQEKFAASITCTSMRAESLRASFDIDSDRIIVAWITARAFNREGLDDDADEMVRVVWRLMRASVTPARQELQRLNGRHPNGR